MIRGGPKNVLLAAKTQKVSSVRTGGLYLLQFQASVPPAWLLYRAVGHYTQIRVVRCQNDVVNFAIPLRCTVICVIERYMIQA